MDRKDCELFLEDVLSLGRQYVETGEEVKRVEETIKRICIVYGFKNPEIYAVTSLIVATIKTDDGEHYTQSVRITKSSTDLGQLEVLNLKARYICENIPDINEFDKIVKNIKRPKPKPIIKCIGYMLAAGGFAVFFGGSWLDGLASAGVAIAIYLMDYHLKIKNINNVVYSFLASLTSGILAVIFTYLGFGNSADKVMIGDIMLFIPGLLLVNSVKEMFNKDIVAGLYKLIEAVFVSVAIAGGFALSVIIMGGILR